MAIEKSSKLEFELKKDDFLFEGPSLRDQDGKESQDWKETEGQILPFG